MYIGRRRKIKVQGETRRERGWREGVEKERSRNRERGCGKMNGGWSEEENIGRKEITV